MKKMTAPDAGSIAAPFFLQEVNFRYRNQW